MIEQINLSESGDYLSVSLPCNWDDDYLAEIIIHVRRLKKSTKVSYLLLAVDHWLESSFSMERLLTIAEIISRLDDSNWKIAVVTSSLNNQSEILQNILLFKGIELSHFTSVDQAKYWFKN